MFRFNKLGLDKISAGEEPTPSNQVEEVCSYTSVQSAPLNSETIVHIDIGTVHSVAVTGTIYSPMIKSAPISCVRLVTLSPTFLHQRGVSASPSAATSMAR